MTEQDFPQATTPVGWDRVRKLLWLTTLWQWLSRVVLRRLRVYGTAVLADVIVVAAAFETAAVLRFVTIPRMVLEVEDLLVPSLVIGVVYAAVSYLFGLHRRLWRYASIQDGLTLMRAVAVSTLLVAGLDLDVPGMRGLLPIGVVIIGSCLSFLFLGCLKMLPRVVHTEPTPATVTAITRVLIVGAGQAGADLADRLLLNSKGGYRLEGFIDDNPLKWGWRIHGKLVFGPVDIIPQTVTNLAIDLIAIAMPRISAERRSQIIAVCQQTPASIKILQGLDEMIGRPLLSLNLREIDVADLLGREVVPLYTVEAREAIQDKVLLITGAAGSIGSELCRQLLTYAPAALIALDTNETGLFDLAESLRGEPCAQILRLRIGDVTDVGSMTRLLKAEHPQFIFHAAAYKHVPLLESHPDQAVHTNVLGTYHLCTLAREHNVERFVFISSDKAAEPVSILGASKRIGELIVHALAESTDQVTRFCAVRFGNVIGSRGSVVPTFAQQIQHGGPITVTDSAATRYFMTIPEACGLVILTSVMADKGGVFLLDMGKPVPISDLAVKMIRSHGLRVERDIHIEYTGLRPGERLHEILAASDEKLLPSPHSKIYRIGNDKIQPNLPTVAQQIQDLEEFLVQGDKEALRTRLFDIAGGSDNSGVSAEHAGGKMPLRRHVASSS
ncbi:MAG: polysaccharide biosynthesis protein [Ktedonobacterales bacterium]